MLKDESRIVRFSQIPPCNTSLITVADWITSVSQGSLTILVLSKANAKSSPRSLTHSEHPLTPRHSIKAFTSLHRDSHYSCSYLRLAGNSSRSSTTQWTRSRACYWPGHRKSWKWVWSGARKRSLLSGCSVRDPCHIILCM